MRNLKYIVALVAILAVVACKKDQYYLYDDVAHIQFGPETGRIYQTSYNLADTLKPFTFFYHDESIKQDTVYFDIYAVGGTTNADRSFTLRQEQVKNAVNAIAGTHYIGFDDPRASKYYVIKARTVHTRVPIILLRSADLKNSTPVLKFNVIADQNFKEGEKSNLWRKIEMTDRLSKPLAWNDSFSKYYFGSYSTVKHAFMIEVTGKKWDQEFISTLALDVQDYYISVVKAALIDYNKANPGNPMKDENGEVVVMP
jgi:hypothetical protein